MSQNFSQSKSLADNEKEIIPLLLRRQKESKNMECGCSTGEEPYSFSYDGKRNRWNLSEKIFATDI